MKQQLAALLAVAVVAGAASSFAQSTAVVTTAAPIYLVPDSTRQPLRTAAVNTTLRVVDDNGPWLKVEFKDPQFGLRVGYVEAKHVQVQAARAVQTPLDLSVGATATAESAPAVSRAHDREPTTASASREAVLPVAPKTASRQFKGAELTVPNGEKNKQVDVTIGYTSDSFQILDDKTRRPLKEIGYKSFVSGEYSYSKSPRWKSGLFISPFLFLSSGKKHWLLVKTADDYAMLRLDKGNYKLVIAEWEVKTGLRVEALADNK
jgi:hypothetical protein